ncbi:MAG: DUF2892 domain-containing protein [Nitrospirae bacterium]|nr:DUF2892 domain-containing protein [Nitrospirota bacterium]
MSIENQIRAIVGTLILASIGLTIYQSPYWFFLTGFVGLNLLQSSFTQFCPLEMMLKKIEGKKESFGYRPGRRNG